MAHEVKNSLTPIRLTMEEIAARQSGTGRRILRTGRADRGRRSRQPGAPRARVLGIFQRAAHRAQIHRHQLAARRTHRASESRASRRSSTIRAWRRDRPQAFADEDLVKGVLTNLLENAAQAVEPGGMVLGVTGRENGNIAIEVHDSGPGINAQARSSLVRAHHLLQAAAAWAWGFPSRARAPCWPAATSCWFAANWEERRSGFCFQWPNPCPPSASLILDDEPNIGSSLRLILEHAGYSVTVARTIADANGAAERADALLLDVRLPDGSGIDFLRQLRERDCPAPAIMISGHGTIAEAVEATRAGAFDFLEKPLGRDKVLVSLKNALEQAGLRKENERLREMVGAATKMIGSSPAFLRVRRAGHHGRPLRRPHSDHGRVRNRQGIAGRAHPSRKSRSPPDHSSR